MNWLVIACLVAVANATNAAVSVLRTSLRAIAANANRHSETPSTTAPTATSRPSVLSRPALSDDEVHRLLFPTNW